MRQTVLGTPAPARLCPASGHDPCVRSYCEGKFCVQFTTAGLQLWWAAGSLLNSTDVESAHHAVRDLSEGYLLPLVVHLQAMTGIAADARALILEDEIAARVAFVGTGPVDQVIAAFLDHGICESRYFERAQLAAEWAGAGCPAT